MADPNRIWRVGNTTWRDTDLPYAAGTDEYYREVARRTAAAKGESYQKSQALLDAERALQAGKGGKSERLRQLELSLQQDELSRPDWRDAAWQERHKQTQAEYAAEMEAYSRGQAALQAEYDRLNGEHLRGQSQWEADIADLARQRDQRGKVNPNYQWVPDPATASAQGAGLIGDPSQGGTLAGTWRAIDGFFSGAGKMGGAGNRNAATGVDNSWNEVTDGIDVRTDEQRFHDRNLKGFEQVANAEGRYDWYANEDYLDTGGQQQQRKVNLSELARRQSSPEQTDPGKEASKKSGFDPNEVWNYNQKGGYGIGEDEYWNAVRNRKNQSTWGRTS